MELKELKKEWVCSEGCNQSFYIKKFQSCCPHLERLISRQGGKGGKWGVNPDIVYTDNLEQFEKWAIKLKSPRKLYKRIEKLQRKLKEFSLTEEELVIIVGRVGYGKSFRELSQELGYSSTWIHKRYKDIIDKLRERGFK